MTFTIAAWGYAGPGALTLDAVTAPLRDEGIEIIHLNPATESTVPDGVQAVWIQGVVDHEKAQALMAEVGDRPLYSSPPVSQELQVATAYGAMRGRPNASTPTIKQRIAVALQVCTPARFTHAARLCALEGGHQTVDPGECPNDIPSGLVEYAFQPQPDSAIGTCGIIGSGLHRALHDDAYLTDIVSALTEKNVASLVWLGSPENMPEDIRRRVDIWLNLTGFTTLGFHGQPKTEEGISFALQHNTPVLTPVPLQRGTVQDWEQSDPVPVGLWPLAVSMNIALPELEAATTPWVFLGRDEKTQHLQAIAPAVQRIASRVERTIRLRNTPVEKRKVSLTIFGYEGDGSIGTAAQMDVFASLKNILERLRDEGYTVDVPATVEELTDAVIGSDGGGKRSAASELARWKATDYASVLGDQAARINGPWGRLPGTVDTDGRDMLIRGARFGNVIVGIQPQFGDVSDPAELLYREDSTPSHSFTAYYLWLEHVFRHDVMVHVGTHGALEFMPGRQTGLFTEDWPILLTGSVPHIYLYVMSNPGEATIAKRRAGATIVTYLTPPLADAGLYGVLEDLSNQLDRLARDTKELPDDIREAATAAGFTDDDLVDVEHLRIKLEEIRRSPIAMGLHTFGEALDPSQTDRTLELAATYLPEDTSEEDRQKLVSTLGHQLTINRELDALMTALSGGYIAPVAGGDPSRRPDALPTGRNIHAIDPVRVPSATAWLRGKRTAERLIAEHLKTHGTAPETVAIVLWGIDNIKTSGEGIAQAFALIGAKPIVGARGRVDSYEIIPLDKLGRPRVDVVCTLSGVCRDILPQPIELLDRAIKDIATRTFEPDEKNPIAAHVRAVTEDTGDGIDVAAVDAATRIFSTAAGSYGTGVNSIVKASTWDTDTDLADMYLTRMGHAWGTGETNGQNVKALLARVLSTVDTTFQNIDSAETSLSGIDHYFEFLGGVSTAAAITRGGKAPVSYVANSWKADPDITTLCEAMRLESRTRLVNPAWIAGQMAHGYAGVAQVRNRLDNTFGMQATTKTVDKWVFDQAADTLLFDDDLRQKMAAANPAAVGAMTNRLLEASDRGLWDASQDRVDKLEEIAEDLDAILEGIENT